MHPLTGQAEHQREGIIHIGRVAKGSARRKGRKEALLFLKKEAKNFFNSGSWARTMPKAMTQR
jgi:hypothetical protein